MQSRFKTALTYGECTKGNIALLFAFLAAPMLMISGAAIDYGLGVRLETKLQAATDATALLLCQAPVNTSEADLNRLAQQSLTGAMGPMGLVIDPLSISNNPRQITVNAHKQSPVFFGKLTKTTIINPGASARCATQVPSVFEIALVLDNTGSMNNAGDDGISKMAALRKAAKNFVTYVFDTPTFAVGTKISIVPFAASVAVDPSTYRYASWVDTKGKSKYHWTNVIGANSAGFSSRFDIFAKLETNYSSWAWAGCFESLPYPQNVTDASVEGVDTLYIPYFAPDEAGAGSVAPAPFDPGKKYQASNSYIDDYNNSSGCPYQAPQSTGASFLAAEGRACKYLVPQNPKAGTLSANSGPNGPNFGCTTQPLQTLTASSTILNSKIDMMTAAGVTNIHEGLMWGWRTISPKSVLFDGTATQYGANSANKIVVLMTDGANNWEEWTVSPNRSQFSSNGYFTNVDGSGPGFHFPTSYQNISNGSQGRAGLDALTRQACSNAGAANVRIFTIGFNVSSDPIDAQGITLLKDCAVSGNGTYIQANNADTLIDAFRQIGNTIGKLRITQ